MRKRNQLKRTVAVGALALSILIPISALRAKGETAVRMAASGGACRTPDAGATQFREYIAGLATGTDSASQSRRAAWSIPAVADSQVVLVSDSTTCALAARAHAIKTGADTLNPPPVHVLQVGPTRFIVFNYTNVGEFLAYYVFDNAFNFVDELMT